MQTRFAVALIVVFLGANGDAQQAFTVDQLLDRASAYVEDLVAKFSRVVAEEQYNQEYLLAGIEGSRGSFTGSPKVAERRALKSDLLLVRPAGIDQLFLFRDVFEVDARPVRDRENRLAKLFLESRDTVTAIERAHELAKASAQFNIREMGTVDNPMLALGFLQGVYRPRFRFTLRGRDVAAGPEAWVVEYRETARPTLMRGSNNSDVFARQILDRRRQRARHPDGSRLQRPWNGIDHHHVIRDRRAARHGRARRDALQARRFTKRGARCRHVRPVSPVRGRD